MKLVRKGVEEIDDRVGGASFLKRSLGKVFPDHWAFMLGEVALYSFVLLVLTGVFLTFFYEPSTREVTYDGPYPPLQGEQMSAAYESVMRISYEVRAGLVMRQIHHWSALVFVAAILVHMLRVFFTGAFRKPRDINWTVGFTLLLLGMGAGFTGYSLPDDLLSGTGIRIGYSALLSIPVIGEWAAFLFFGGEYPAPAFLRRFYALHIMIIPGLLIGAMTVHLMLVWRQKHTEFDGPGRSEHTVTGTRLWPNYGMKALGLMFVVFGTLSLLGGLFQVNPIWLYGPFVPYSASSPAQPDWYMGWIEGLVRLAPNWTEFSVFGYLVAEPFIPAVVLPGIFITIVALWPVLERRFTGDHEMHNLLQRPRDAPIRTALGVAGVTIMAVLTLAGSNDVLAKFLQIEVDTLNEVFKWLLLLAPPAAGYLTYRICRELRDRDEHPIRRPRRVRVRWNAEGGFDDVEDDAPPGAGSPGTRPEERV
ncbi:MAG: cytochrome bc complex cytochrome b subunit [Actinomycetota bacterium]